MKIKTNELTGIALDWAVAKAEGEGAIPAGEFWRDRDSCDGHFRYSEDWSQGGPIIEREKIQINPSISSSAWGACNPSKDRCVWVWADSPLIAAMRCYVASELGDEVEVPDELAQ